ncbi:hypothetical protein Agub_g4799 [Astrephomene gubernaculifera]|uniref:Zinc finger LSD1-type domain-containing protein n=1 Tax=Astrephomene gubernaculifera TaxID=47775 RepID=A0AAD3DKU1_9CHLO|nr:hypothetical protein Agub_g4799 [Astrephomene gubernaculifera]
MSSTMSMYSYSTTGGVGSNQGHLVCGGCQVLLMYPPGASNVRCSRCGHITQAPTSAGADSAQIVCNGCRVLLSYPRGAQSVQCAMCHAVTQVPVYGHLVCNGCSIMLMYPTGAQSVKCSVCHCVTPVTASAPAGSNPAQPQQQQQQPQQASRPKPVQTVVVENPPSVDDKGNEVANIAVGVKADS